MQFGAFVVTKEMQENWRSGLSLSLLAKRSHLLMSLRRFFEECGFLEVDVPVLGSRGVSDPHVHGIEASVQNQRMFLQTSPEYFMKRLLAGGSGSIYYLGKSFRNDQPSRRHNPEFTMLEWYFLGANDEQLMSQLEALLVRLAPNINVQRRSYKELFVAACGLDPHSASLEALKEAVAEHLTIDWDENDRSTLLDLIFTHKIEPNLLEPTIVYHYPQCQCALAKVKEDESGQLVAKRFELFWKGLELANGYWELTDAKIQKERFLQDLEVRKQFGYPALPLDEAFLSAVEFGLPECAGIALGVDRLFMCLENIDSINSAQCFSFERS